MRTALLATVLLLLIAACAPGNAGTAGDAAAPYEPPGPDLFGTRLVASGIVDAGGGVERIGFGLPLSVVENAASVPTMSSARIALPPDTQGKTFIDHVQVDWEPNGHIPEVFEVPHFDFHFYAITGAEQDTIDCSDKTMPTALPPGYVLPPDTCEPRMGYHAADANAPPFSPPQNFTDVMILGYYRGEPVFVEPMVTRATLLSRKSFALPIARPPTLGAKTLFPTRFTAEYDAGTDSYRMALEGFSAAGPASPTGTGEENP